MRFEDLTGLVFGRLKVISFSHSNERNESLWLCRCECGKRISVVAHCLKCGHTRSCGCLKRDLSKSRTGNKNPAFRHGKAGRKPNNKFRVYRVWSCMLARCENPKHLAFKNYGGRGIKVCEKWHDAAAFIKWATESGYKDGLTIDRIDNDGNYEPFNCQWMTKSENSKKAMRERISRRLLTEGRP